MATPVHLDAVGSPQRLLDVAVELLDVGVATKADRGVLPKPS